MLALTAATVALAPPTRLICLQHGLYGDALHLSPFAEQLQRLSDETTLVHLASANEGRTRDGVAAGGLRLANEVRDVVAQNPTLTGLSLVGNSLGGLYVRAAAAELFDEGSGRMAGLLPDALLTTGTPHLGVRSHLYLPLPRVLHALGRPIAGQTAVDLLLCDNGGADGDGVDGTCGEPLLLTMADPHSRHGRALRAFRRRRAYANLCGDFMVPFGTAAMMGTPWGAGAADERYAAAFEASRTTALTFPGGRGFVDEGDAPSPDGGRRGADAANVPWEGATRLPWEERMRLGLRAASWSRVSIRFDDVGTFAPLAHNRLPCVRRRGWRRAFEWVEQAHKGAPVVEHAARYLLADVAAGS